MMHAGGCVVRRIARAQQDLGTCASGAGVSREVSPASVSSCAGIQGTHMRPPAPDKGKVVSERPVRTAVPRGR